MEKNMKTKAMLILAIALALLPLPSLWAQGDTRYNTDMNLPFNAKAGEVNPQTGDISLQVTDLSLPGRGGYGFSFGRTWTLSQSNAFNMYFKDGANRLNSNTVERTSRLGAGWRSSLPVIIENTETGYESTYLFFGSSAFQIDRAGVEIHDDQKSNLKGYDLLDLRIYKSQAVSYSAYDDGGLPRNFSALKSQYVLADNSGDTSVYQLILKSNETYWFRADGKIMMQEDRTGLNRIWYFYQNAPDGGSRLKLVVDIIGREIVFGYNTDGNLSSISWPVTYWSKTGETRSQQTETRSVQYHYQSAESALLTTDEWNAWKSSVNEYKTPYLLVATKDPMNQSLGSETHYSYSTGTASFTYDSKNAGHRSNLYILLTGQTQEALGTAYRNKRTFEYQNPAEGAHSKLLYAGFMEYFKISRQYFVDRHGRVMNDNRYVYHDEGEQGNYNQYQAVIQCGGVKSTYTYLLSDVPKERHVLKSLRVETEDGSLALTDYAYNDDRTKKAENVYRQGQWVYGEAFQYDDKGNLKWHRDRQGLITSRIYDQVYSIPTEEEKVVTVDGSPQTYRTVNVLDDKGLVIRQTIFLSGRAVDVAKYVYDVYGNPVSQTDALGQITTTVFDSVTHSFPIKSYQNVDGTDWPGGIDSSWKQAPPTQKKTRRIRSWRVFNSDGSVWLELDESGAGVEHYYDKRGAEIQTIFPNADDPRGFAIPIWVDASDQPLNGGDDFEDFTGLASFSGFLSARSLNPGMRKNIDYLMDKTVTTMDLDVGLGLIKESGVQGNGLGNVEEEIEYAETENYSKRMSYDNLGQMIAMTDADAGAAYTIVTIHDTQVEKHDKTWLVKYDDLGRKIQVIYPKTEENKTPSVKQIYYNDVENITTGVDEEGRTTVEKRDWNGNVIEMTQYGDSRTSTVDRQVTKFVYDELNRKTAMIDPRGITVRYRYDERGLLVQEEYEPEDGSASLSDMMTYDDNGQLVERKDRKGQRIVLSYDRMGRKILETYFDSTNLGAGSLRTDYNERGAVVRSENTGLIEHFVYDISGRLITLDRKLGDALSVERSRIGQQLWGGALDPVFSFTYQYNDAGFVTQMGYPDGSNHYFTYQNRLGRLVKIEQMPNGGTRTSFVDNLEYNKSGVVNKMTYANNTVQTWTFDNRKRISHIAVGSGGAGSNILDLSYQLNGVGDITSINNNEYGYDGFDRLISAKTLIPTQVNPNPEDPKKLVDEGFGAYQALPPLQFQGEIREYSTAADLNADGRINGLDLIMASFTQDTAIYDIESFAYDKSGNRISLVQNGVEFIYEYGVMNKLERIYKKTSPTAAKELYIEYAYDANGNTIQRKTHAPMGIKTENWTYDVLNRLVQSGNASSSTTKNYYDTAGNRFLKESSDGSVTLYLRHGALTVAMDLELPALTESGYKGKINRYVLSGDLLAGRVATTVNTDNSTTESSNWYHLDHLNSTKAVTNAAATIEIYYEYRAFGEALSELGSGTAKYTYGGKELDFDKNLYYFNARFYDATMGRFINIDPVQARINWFLYCHNNPLSFCDPTGLSEPEETYGAILSVTGNKAAQGVAYIMSASVDKENLNINENITSFQKIIAGAGETVNIGFFEPQKNLSLAYIPSGGMASIEIFGIAGTYKKTLMEPGLYDIGTLMLQLDSAATVDQIMSAMDKADLFDTINNLVGLATSIAGPVLSISGKLIVNPMMTTIINAAGNISSAVGIGSDLLSSGNTYRNVQNKLTKEYMKQYNPYFQKELGIRFGREEYSKFLEKIKMDNK